MLLPRKGEVTPVEFGTRRHSRYWSPLSMEEVLEEISQRVKKDPEDLKALLQRARMLMRLEDYHGALTDLTALLEKIQRGNDSDELVQALFYRGVCHERLLCIDEAIADFTAALDADPIHRRSAYERAACHNRKGNFIAAILDYERALQHDMCDYVHSRYRTARSKFANALLKDATSSSTSSSPLLLARRAGLSPTGTASPSYANTTAENHGNGRPNLSVLHVGIQASNVAKKASTGANVSSTPHSIPYRNRSTPNASSNHNSEAAEIHHQRGLMYRKQGDMGHAIEEYTAAINLDAKNFKALFNRGFCHDKLGNYDEAIRDYEAAMHLEPGYAYTYYNLGISYDRKGDHFEEAIRMFDKAIALDGSNADFYHNRGFSRRKMGDYREAVNDYTTALTLDPQHFKAYYNRAFCYDKLGDIANAIEDYTNAIAIHKENPNAYHNRGSALEKLGRLDDAVVDYTQAIELDGKNPFTYAARGMIYDRLGSHSAALHDLTQSITLAPCNATFYQNRGSVYQNMKHFQEAIQDYDTALRLGSKSTVTGYEAVFDSKKAQEISMTRTKIYNNRGFCCACKGHYEEAVRDFSKVIAVDPGNIFALYNRGIAYDKLGNHGLAIDDFSRLIDVDPGDANAHFCRASALESLQKYAAALDDYTVALALDVDQSGLADVEADLNTFKTKHRATTASQRVLRLLKEQDESTGVQIPS